MNLQTGTLTLGGVILGLLIGLVVQQIPLAVAVGLTIGVGLDSWNRKRHLEI
jgi:hypothetical protein